MKKKTLAAAALPIALGVLAVGLLVERSSGHPAVAGPVESQPLGGDLLAARSLLDPNPTFNGIAADGENSLIVVTDTNRKSILVYDRAAGLIQPAQVSQPRHRIVGPATNIGFVAGTVVDPQHHEIFAVNNDIEDALLVVPYDGEGNVKPSRLLAVPHQAWGLALSPSRNEIAVTVEIQNAVVFYRRTADGGEAPLRSIQGPHTGMADPHGVYWDETHQEIGVANHGNFHGLAKNVGFGCEPGTAAEASEAGLPAESGKFQPPSVTVYSAGTEGDARPLRVIQGPKTQLDWPMGITVNPAHNEVAVANNGDDSILIFSSNAKGDVAPVRRIQGGRTGISRPMGIAMDTRHDEIWVSNFGEHTAVAFPRTANGNVPPRRVIRSGPPGAPSTGFGNPMALAYDSKREEILVPN